MKRRHLGVFAIAAVAIVTGLVSPAAGVTDSKTPVRFRARLTPVPHDSQADAGSSVRGLARLRAVDERVRVRLTAGGLTEGLPHAMHIHGVLTARNECPPASADINDEVFSTEPGTPDGLVSLGEGDPFYGPVQVSFTTRGDTSPASALDLPRFPTADGAGDVMYERRINVPGKVAARMRTLHIVVHGVDLNGDGEYSNLMEATLPAACGEINRAA